MSNDDLYYKVDYLISTIDNFNRPGWTTAIKSLYGSNSPDGSDYEKSSINHIVQWSKIKEAIADFLRDYRNNIRTKSPSYIYGMDSRDGSYMFTVISTTMRFDAATARRNFGTAFASFASSCRSYFDSKTRANNYDTVLESDFRSFLTAVYRADDNIKVGDAITNQSLSRTPLDPREDDSSLISLFAKVSIGGHNDVARNQGTQMIDADSIIQAEKKQRGSGEFKTLTSLYLRYQKLANGSFQQSSNGKYKLTVLVGGEMKVVYASYFKSRSY